MIQNIILKVLEAWALELSGISHISDAGKYSLDAGICISILLCCGIIYLPDINGEAYPENSFIPTVYYGNCRNAEGIAVYYVIQVAPGKEAETEMYIMERVPEELYSSCFHLVRHVRKKFRGQWKDRHEKLLPGYVFVNSERVQELYMAFRHIPAMTKLLGWEREFITALNDQETVWLKKIAPADREGSITGEVPVSQIEIDENDEVRILSGPLQDMEGMIKRINLHRRIAEVEVEFMGRKTVIYLGIEMIRKK